MWSGIRERKILEWRVEVFMGWVPARSGLCWRRPGCMPGPSLITCGVRFFLHQGLGRRKGGALAQMQPLKGALTASLFFFRIQEYVQLPAGTFDFV